VMIKMRQIKKNNYLYQKTNYKGNINILGENKWHS